MTDYPFMPLDVAVILADTTTLTTREFGAYNLLIDHMWLHKGRLPDDDQELARICRMTVRGWQAMRSRLARFLTFEEGFVTQKRVLKTLEKVLQKVDKNRSSKERFLQKKLHSYSNKNKDLQQSGIVDARARNQNHNKKEKEKEKRDIGNGGGAMTSSPGFEGRSSVTPELPQMEEAPPAATQPLTEEQEAERIERLKSDWPSPADHLFAKLKHH
jgi:uncharacterized protein YdaU (DUF1376 family)